MRKLVCNVSSLLKSGKGNWIVLIMIVVALVISAPMQKIEIGQRGVLYNSMKGDISDQNVTPGWHVVIPFVQILKSYPINERVYRISRDDNNWKNGIDASIIAPTSDNQKISIDATIIYTLDEKELRYFFNRFDGNEIKEIEAGYLNDIFKSHIVTICSQYSAYDIYSTKREEIQDRIFEELEGKLNETRIHLKYVLIDTVRLSAEMESIIKAQALAEAAKIEAQGKSDANKLISDSLSDKIISYEALSKLSESLKLVVVPSGTDNQIDFSKIMQDIINQPEEAKSE